MTLKSFRTMALPGGSWEQSTLRIEGVDGVDGSASEVLGRGVVVVDGRKTSTCQSIETSFPGPVVTDGVGEPNARARSREDVESASEVVGGAGIVDAVGCEDAKVGFAKERRIRKISSPVESRDSSCRASSVSSEVVQDVRVVVREPDLGGPRKGGDSETRETDASPELDDGRARPAVSVGDDPRGQKFGGGPEPQADFVPAVIDA